MSVFLIHFLNFGVFVHHKRGLSVVLGSEGHELHYTVSGGTHKSIPKGTTIHLRVHKDGREINGGPTRSHAGSYMLPLEWLFGGAKVIDRDRVLGATTDRQNGRIHLHGGDLMDHAGGTLDEEHELADALWDFKAFGAPAPSLHRITNRATFAHPVESGFDYTLEFSNGTREVLRAGTQIIIENEDTTETKENCEDLSKMTPGSVNRELQRLLPAVGIDPGSAVARLHSVPRSTPPPGKICQPCDVVETHQGFD
jgi:hypothetical protein